jgi:hypothetical protein
LARDVFETLPNAKREQRFDIVILDRRAARVHASRPF